DPARRCPKLTLCPTTTCRSSRCAPRNSRTNASGSREAKRGVKRCTTITSAPSSRRCARRSRRDWRSGDARSGASTVVGCGWKVTTTTCPPAARASRTARCTIARCPRCTPSKLPRVSTTRRSGGETCARWRITRIAAARIAQARAPLKLLVELGQLLARQSRLGRRGVVLDELRHREARVGRISHAEEELPLLPQRRRRLVALRVPRDDIVELRHCT